MKDFSRKIISVLVRPNRLTLHGTYINIRSHGEVKSLQEGQQAISNRLVHSFYPMKEKVSYVADRFLPCVVCIIKDAYKD